MNTPEAQEVAKLTFEDGSSSIFAAHHSLDITGDEVGRIITALIRPKPTKVEVIEIPVGLKKNSTTDAQVR